MKRNLWSLGLMLLCSVLFAGKAAAQGCTPNTYYNFYESSSLDSNLNIVQTATTDGYATMDLEYCPGAANAVHTPYVTNEIIEPNGTVHGGRYAGPSGCVNCYLSESDTETISPVDSVIYSGDTEGDVICQIAGEIAYFVSNFHFERAYTRFKSIPPAYGCVLEPPGIELCTIAVQTWCSPGTTPPDFVRSKISGPVLPPPPINNMPPYFDMKAYCARYSTGPWSCTPGVGPGLQGIQFQAFCTHNP